MSTEVKAPIDIVGLRERLSKVTYDNLKVEAETLGVPEVWKGGVNKQTMVEKIIKAYVAKTESESTVVEETQVSEPEAIVEPSLEEQIPVGEYDVDEETLDEFPGLVELGFNVGDVLVVEEGKPFYKKEVEEIIVDSPEELKIKPEDPAFGTEGIVSHLTPEEADELIKKENGGIEYNENLSENSEEVIGEYVPEVINETLFTEEELQENIDICTANCSQALPQTKIFLLRKIDALQAALERKQK